MGIDKEHQILMLEIQGMLDLKLKIGQKSDVQRGWELLFSGQLLKP
jgi:hypothetical protein